MSQTIEVRVPDLGNFPEVSVIDVLVKPGDTVAVDTPLITLETEKATMDVPSSAAGTVTSNRQLRPRIDHRDGWRTVTRSPGSGCGGGWSAASGSPSWSPGSCRPS